MANFVRRVRVIGPTLGLMTVWVAWFNGGIALLPVVTSAQSAVFLLGPYAGPFVGLLGHVIGFEDDPLGDAVATGLPLLVAIASRVRGVENHFARISARRRAAWRAASRRSA